MMVASKNKPSHSWIAKPLSFGSIVARYEQMEKGERQTLSPYDANSLINLGSRCCWQRYCFA
jgi:hypothetical protein